jgi:hypothetical protein
MTLVFFKVPYYVISPYSIYFPSLGTKLPVLQHPNLCKIWNFSANTYIKIFSGKQPC